MRFKVILLLLIFVSVQSVMAQRRPVSVIHDNAIYNYAITRYVPVWDVTSKGKAGDGLLTQHRQFFQVASSSSLQAFKDLIYSKGMVPSDVSQLDGKALESRLSKDRFTIHYRIQHGNYSIFVGHLNDSPVRSVIPFIIEGSKWTIATEFVNTGFYELLISSDFDPYMGLKDGKVVCSYGFEEVNGLINYIQDYSGNGNHATRNGVTIVDGRFGGALKVSGSEATSVVVNRSGELVNGFSIDFHLQVARMVYNTERRRTVIHVDGYRLETSDGLLRLSYPLASGTQVLEWAYTPDVWVHLSLDVNRQGVTVRENGKEVASSRMAPLPMRKEAKLSIGAQSGFKGIMDELRLIAR